jgi:hypothetical protein
MAVTITGETILAQVIRKGGLGMVLPNADIGAIAAGTLTSVLHLRSGHYDTNTFRNKGTLIYRPGNATGVADYVRSAGDLVASTGVLSNDANWADTTLGSENVYLLDGIHPTWFVECLNIAMRRVYFENMEPLSTKPAGALVADAGFQSTATTNYTESDADSGPATTHTRVSTANSENVFTGIGAGKIVNAAANGYIRQRYNVTEGEQVIQHALSRLDVGTSAFTQLYDISGSANVGSSVTHGQEAWQWMRNIQSVPADCKILEARYGATGASDEAFYNAASVLFPAHSRVNLDTTWDTAFKIPALVSLEMGGSGADANCYPAHSTRMVEIPRSDYDFLFERPGANPYAVQFHGGSQERWFQNPVYIQGRRAYGDLTTFSLALSETTACDLDLITAATLTALFEDQRVASRVSDAQERLGAARRELQGQASIHQTTGPALRRKRMTVARLPN